nr:spore germination protein [Thalassobacillus sp. C254]
MGLIGVSLGMAFLLVHLLGLTSLGRPYLAPIYPLRLPDLKDSFIRLPFTKQSRRPKQVRPQSLIVLTKLKPSKRRISMINH